MLYLICNDINHLNCYIWIDEIVLNVAKHMLIYPNELIGLSFLFEIFEQKLKTNNVN